MSEEEIEAYYAAHEREYLYEYRVSQILVGTPEDAERVTELLETKSWDVGREPLLDRPGAKRGGDLGYLTKGNMIPELEAIVFDMKPGETTGVIKSDFGYHIFRLDDVREALVAVGLDDVREQIMNTLMLEKRKNGLPRVPRLAQGEAPTSRTRTNRTCARREREPQADTSGAYEDADTTETP